MPTINNTNSFNLLRRQDGIELHAWIGLYVGIASMFGIILLSLSIFDVPLLLSLTFGACVLIAHCFRLGCHLPRMEWGSGVTVAVLILAVTLRADIYPHLMGGQDQGLYTNFAHIMLHEKGLHFIDIFRAELPNELKKVYDSVQMASVSFVDHEHSRMTIDFYPLHPMWMAIFGWLLGEKHQTLSLVFFSLIYLIAAKELTKELFRDNRAEFVTLLFFATNPVLVFFSKFPVAETVALAFSLNGMLFLYRGTITAPSRLRWFYLVLALLCFNAFFFTRMQFFLYAPFFIFIFIATAVSAAPFCMKRDLVLAVSLQLLLFCISLFWYYKFQPHLITSLFGSHLSRLLSPTIVGFVFLFFFIFAVVVFSLRRQAKFLLNVLLQRILDLAGWLLVIAFLFSIPSVIKLYQTGLMPPFDAWILDTTDQLLIRYHVIYRLMLMISPIGLGLLFFSAALSRNIPLGGRLLIFFLATAWFVILLQPWVPYLYYYGRYLAGDMLPYGLIAISGLLCVIYSKGWKKISTCMMTIILVYQLIYSIFQFSGIESEKINGYADFLSNINTNDIVVAIGVDDRLLVPLRVTYKFSIVAVDSFKGDVFNANNLIALQKLSRKKGGRLLFMSNIKNKLNIGFFSGQAQFVNSFFSNGEHPRLGIIQQAGKRSALLLPIEIENRHESWVFFDASNVDITQQLAGGMCDRRVDFFKGSMSRLSIFALTGFSDPEDHGRWSMSENGSIQCEVPDELTPSTIRIDAKAFLHQDMKQRVIISVNNGAAQTFYFDQHAPSRMIELPIVEMKNNALKIDFVFMDATSPKEVGLSADPRKLGLSIRSLYIE